MHRVAEYGIAAHALYKDGLTPAKQGNGDGNGQRGLEGSTRAAAYEWLRRTIEMLAEGDTPEEFLEHTKLELFQDQVFCFTPKGRLIALPRGATPIDFAYAVHTDIGDTCVGAKINGRTMPLMTELHNGDEVEIICAKGQVPPAGLGNDGRHRQGALGHPPRDPRRRARKQYAGSAARSSSAPSTAPSSRSPTSLSRRSLPRLRAEQLEDMLAAVGRGEIPSANVVQGASTPITRRNEQAREAPRGARKAGSASSAAPA